MFERICKPQEADPGWGNVIITDKKLSPDSLLVETRSFKSKNNDFIVGIQSKDRNCTVDTSSKDEFYQKHWYFIQGKAVKEISPEGFKGGYTVRPLSIEPIDAADFDGDGKVEWVFRQNTINAGGIGSNFILLNHQLEEVTTSSITMPALPREDD